MKLKSARARIEKKEENIINRPCFPPPAGDASVNEVLKAGGGGRKPVRSSNTRCY